MNDGRPFKKTSRVPLKDYRLPEARLAVLKRYGHDIRLPGIQAAEAASVKLIENAIGSFPIPIGIATNFVINGEERLVAMAIEEKSVVAGASYAAKLCRENGGFSVIVGPNVMRGHILFASTPKWQHDAFDRLGGLNQLCRKAAEELDCSERQTRAHCRLITDGFGHEVSACRLDGGFGRPSLLVINFQMDVGNAMGANAVTRFGEDLAALLEPIIGAKRKAVICSDDATHLSGSEVKVQAAWPIALLGKEVAETIVTLQHWADADPARAVTHNKGAMNGVSAVALATGQDVRAIEAASHAKAAYEGMPYAYSKTLTNYEILDRNLVGWLKLRVPLGTVGGATSHPTAVQVRKLMDVENFQDLAAVIGAVGLAQNFAALRMLADEGVGEAHSRLKET